MEKDFLKEQLNCLGNEMTHLWGTTFLLGGGAISIIFNSRSLKGYILGIIGVVFAVILAHTYLIRRNETLRIVNMLKEKK